MRCSSWDNHIVFKQAQKAQNDAAGAVAAKAAFYAQQTAAYEEAEERRLFDLRVRIAAVYRNPPAHAVEGPAACPVLKPPPCFLS